MDGQTEGGTHGGMDKQTGGQKDRVRDGCMVGGTDGRMDQGRDKVMDRWMD